MRGYNNIHYIFSDLKVYKIKQISKSRESLAPTEVNDDLPVVTSHHSQGSGGGESGLLN